MNTRQKSIETCLVLTVAFVILYYFFRNENLLCIAIFFGLVGLLFPWLAEKISLIWLKFSETLGAVISKILLSFIFIIFLIPISILYKIAKRNDNLLNLKKHDASYWVAAAKEFPKENFKKIW